MALTSAGLPNGGLTTNGIYQFQYDDSLAGTGGPEPARSAQVMSACEADFTLMQSWFAGTKLPKANFPIPVSVVQSKSVGGNPGKVGSASWRGSNPSLTIYQTFGAASDIRYLMVAEMTEVFMMRQGIGWFGKGNEGSSGEGLSRFLAVQFYVNYARFGPTTSAFVPGNKSNLWMKSDRLDYVNTVDPKDNGPDARTGCATLFLWYLSDQLGFTINEIVAAGSETLADVYRKLTGDTGDPFPSFKHLLDTAYPGKAAITTGNLDNPFPLGILSFWLDKSTFGRDEVQDVIQASGGRFPSAFWLVLEGFNRANFLQLPMGNPTVSGPFAKLPGVSITSDGAGAQFETDDRLVPQRIRFGFDIRFTEASLAAFPDRNDFPVGKKLNAATDNAGAPLPGASAATEFELVGGADPYFTNIDPARDNHFWLSQDVRVFAVTPGINDAPIPGVTPMKADTYDAAYTYIQDVLAYLNDKANGFTDGTRDPFAGGVIPQQGAALSAYSSVSAYTDYFLEGVTAAYRNYNFAIARVRLRGTGAPAGTAKHVKVFFRAWAAATPDTGFDPTGNYNSHLENAKPQWPKPAPDLATIPFFATENTPDLADPDNAEYGKGGVNNRKIAIESGDTAWAYFGCFLNFFDPHNKLNGAPVQAILAGTHHCLVAEIAYDGAPIVNLNGVVESPENSDKMAQRNLQVTASDNPGPPETHRVPQAFDLKPGVKTSSEVGQLLDYPDELMIDWGRTPAGTKASIYWPQVKSTRVLEMADRLYGTHLLGAPDANTIECAATRGVTYVPIPAGTSANIAGLFTVDLPAGVVVGQEFDIIVRRVTTRLVDPIPVQTVPSVEREAAAELEESGTALEPLAAGAAPPTAERVTNARAFHVPTGADYVTTNWRKVIGAFQVKIPVTTRKTMLRPDQDALAVLKWRIDQIGPTSRWYPVLQRYVDYLSARIKGLGADPGAIPASPDGAPTPGPIAPPVVPSFTGHVKEVIFDCAGRFEGFVLAGCCETRTFTSSDCHIAELALRACKDHLSLTVELEDHGAPCIRRLLVRCC
jgi:hypothetical protein